MANPEIFTKRGCGWAQRNYAALLEKGAGFSLVSSTGPDGEKTEEFLSLTPLGMTPVLRDGSTVVLDSTLINMYIEAQYKGNSLMPDDSADATIGVCQAHYCDQVLHPALSECARQKLATINLWRPLEVLNRSNFFEKRGGPYWYGERFTLVDLAFLTFFQTVDFLEKQGTEVRSLLSERVLEWERAILGRESVMRAIDLAREFDAQPRTIKVAAA